MSHIVNILDIFSCNHCLHTNRISINIYYIIEPIYYNNNYMNIWGRGGSSGEGGLGLGHGGSLLLGGNAGAQGMWGMHPSLLMCWCWVMANVVTVVISGLCSGWGPCGHCCHCHCWRSLLSGVVSIIVIDDGGGGQCLLGQGHRHHCWAGGCH